jgi:hypothetical protein
MDEYRNDDYLVFKIRNYQIVDGEIPDGLLKEIRVGATELDLSGCSSLNTLPDLPPNLQWLDLSGCSSLNTLPELPQNLERLDLSGCSSLNTLPDLPPNLQKLDLSACSSLNTLPDLPPSLQYLNLSGCSSLNTLPDLPPSLQYLNLYVCSSLNTLPELPQNLESLNLYGCSSLNTLPDLPPNLQWLDLSGCSSLTTLPNLPPNLQRLDLSGCSSLETLPDLPKSLRYLDLSGCNQLSLESIRKLEALEEANQHNPNFQLIWPEHLASNSQVITNLKDAYQKYHSSNPDFAGIEPNISDQVNYPTLYLFHRFTSERLENRGKKEVVISASLVAKEINNNPQLLEILDNKSKNYLTACVNQPVCGFAEIATLVEIAKQDNITAKIQKAKILRVQQLIKNNIITLTNSNGDIVGERVQVELGNAMLREVHKKLLAQKIISQPWPGIPGNIAYEATIQSFLNDDNIEKMSNLAKEALSSTPESQRETINFLCEVETDFWAKIILDKEDSEVDNKKINKLKEEIIDSDPNEENFIRLKQEQINEIQRNQSANLVKKLQQKTRDLLEANQVSLQNSISPASFEPDVTTTIHHTNRSAGVFGEGLESNPSLYHRLRESEFELSGDMVILTGEPQTIPNTQPQSSQPNTSSNLSRNEISRTTTNVIRTSALIKKIKNGCCVIS